MAVFYRLAQDKRQKFGATDNPNYNKWYAHAVTVGTVDTKKLAQLIQDNVSVKRSDVLAVLDELVQWMAFSLKEGKRVKLNGFGSFKIGIASKGADSPAEFTSAKHITGSRVNFSPEMTWSALNGNKRVRVFLGEEIDIEELPINTVVKDD